MQGSSPWGSSLERVFQGWEEMHSLFSTAALFHKKYLHIHLNREQSSIPQGASSPPQTHHLSPLLSTSGQGDPLKNLPSSKTPKTNPTKNRPPSPRLIYPLGSDQKGLGSLETHVIDQCWSLHSLRASPHSRPRSPKAVEKLRMNPLL